MVIHQIERERKGRRRVCIIKEKVFIIGRASAHSGK